MTPAGIEPATFRFVGLEVDVGGGGVLYFDISGGEWSAKSEHVDSP